MVFVEVQVIWYALRLGWSILNALLAVVLGVGIIRLSQRVAILNSPMEGMMKRKYPKAGRYVKGGYARHSCYSTRRITLRIKVLAAMEVWCLRK